MKRALLLACLLAAHPALALEACFADSTGPWRGPVRDSGRLKTMHSEFHLDAAGALAGTYHVGGDAPYDGTLDSFRPTAPCEADFQWHDQFGAGIVHIRFAPEHGRFEGLWGDTEPIDGQFFNGRRTRPVPIS